MKKNIKQQSPENEKDREESMSLQELRGELKKVSAEITSEGRLLKEMQQHNAPYYQDEIDSQQRKVNLLELKLERVYSYFIIKGGELDEELKAMMSDIDDITGITKEKLDWALNVKYSDMSDITGNTKEKLDRVLDLKYSK